MRNAVHEQQCCAGTGTEAMVYETAQALSEAALQAPATYDTLASAYIQAVLGQLTKNTVPAIQIATEALAALRFAQQPLIVQVITLHSSAIRNLESHVHKLEPIIWRIADSL